MEKKQNSVEYLMEMIKLNSKDFYAMLFEDKVFEKAKEMEKKQVIETAKYYFHERGKLTPEQYYNQTFKSE